MVDVPPVKPVTIPVPEPAVATAVLLLAHEPPLVVLLSVVVDASHKVSVPVIDEGSELTVTTWVAVAVPHEVITA